MRRWRRSTVWVAVLIGVTVGLTVLLGGLQLSRFHDSYRAQFTSRVTLSAQIFTESVSQATGTDQLQALTRSFVRGDVRYAQVVHGGEVVAEHRTGVADRLDLSILDRDRRLGVERHTRTVAGAAPILELIRPIRNRRLDPGAQGLSYVRVGFSLAPVQNAVQAEALLTIGVVLGMIGLVSGLGTIYLLRRPKTSPARDDPAASEATPTAAPSDGVDEREPDRAARWAAGEAEGQDGHDGLIQIDAAGKEVRVAGQPVELTPKEFELLQCLASEPGRVFSNQEILEAVWGTDVPHAPTSKDVKQYIYLLRKKLERDTGCGEIIVTVRGFGYKLDQEAIQTSSTADEPV